MRKTRIWQWLLLLTIALSALGCATRQAGAPMPAREPMVVVEEVVVEREAAKADADGVPTWSGKDDLTTAVQDIQRKIIYNVSLHLIVKDTDETFAEVQRLTQEMGGFIAQSNSWRSDGHRQASITVRVPVSKLSDALNEYRALALDVENERVDSQDVTEEYVDLEARLGNEQRTESELQELLETRSELGKTEDILEVHRELSRVRAEIERIQGRMRYLDNLSDMATVEITLTPDELMQPIDVAGWRPEGTARDAIRMLLRTLQFFADAAIVFVLYILPVLIVIAIPITILVLIVRTLVRRARRRRRTKSAE